MEARELADLPWLVPVSLALFDAELPERLGNHFSLVFARLPLGGRTFAERLAELTGASRGSVTPTNRW
ncbi:hypothetical protein AB0K15_46290 [Amycolatopsis sp. NPDC049253]|uniref:hypothetical protein n=1 Tax=Amycolatopsis sp. NPDC049253 TaxID=3155274 RepID=UPI00343A3801